MARSRNIKPGFFINDKLAEIDPLGRLLFIGLWTIADREGRLEYRPARIKVETLPYDNCDIEKLLEDLEKREFIVTYFHEDSRYIQIVNFSKHQNPHRNEKQSEIPAQEDIEKLPDNSGTSTVQAQEMHSTNRADSFNMIPDSLNTDSLNSESSKGDPKSKTVVVEKNEWNEINKLFVECFGSPMSNGNMKLFESYLADGLSTWHIHEALVICKEQGGKTIKYVKGILNNWLNQKAFTKEQVQAINNSFSKQSKNTQVFDENYQYSERASPAPGFFGFLEDG